MRPVIDCTMIDAPISVCKLGPLSVVAYVYMLWRVRCSALKLPYVVYGTHDVVNTHCELAVDAGV